MEQLITHACGHGQLHHLAGYASQQERKASWLRTTQCRACFVAARRTEETAALAGHVAALAHLDLPTLSGSDRQVAWAATIRAKRLSGILASVGGGASTEHQVCLQMTDAKWWIDHRDMPDDDLIKAAGDAGTGIPQAA